MKTINKTVISVACLALLSICAPQGFADPRPSSVTVVNTPDNPVPVNVQNQVPVTVQNEIATRSADNPAFQPYSETNGAFSTDYFAILAFPVPAGKRLVIEYVGVHVLVPGGQNVSDISVSVSKLQTAGITFHLPRVAEGREFISNKDTFAAGQSLRLYSDSSPDHPFRSVSVFVARNSTANLMEVTASVSGYLVDVTP